MKMNKPLVDFDNRVQYLLDHMRLCHCDAVREELIELGVDPLGAYVGMARANEIWMMLNRHEKAA